MDLLANEKRLKMLWPMKLCAWLVSLGRQERSTLLEILHTSVSMIAT